MSAALARVSGMPPSFDPELELSVPDDDVENPEFSIVIPELPGPWPAICSRPS